MAALKKKSRNVAPIEIVAVEQLESVMAALFYGRSGTGKTTIASTFPKPLLLLDIKEKGTDSVSNVRQLDVGRIEEWDDFVNVYWYLEKGGTKYKTVVVDQITQLQDLAIAQAMHENGKKPGDPIAKRDWGQAAGLMKTWLLNYRDLIDKGISVVFLAHDRVTREDDDASDAEQLDPSVGARIMPSVAGFLNGAVKMIGNTYIREQFNIVGNRKVRSVEYAMRIGPHAYYTTKTRSPVGIVAPSTVVNPDYDKLMQVMAGTYEEEAPSKLKKKVVKK